VQAVGSGDRYVASVVCREGWVCIYVLQGPVWCVGRDGCVSIAMCCRGHCGVQGGMGAYLCVACRGQCGVQGGMSVYL
jgi:hypothetical protein